MAEVRGDDGAGVTVCFLNSLGTQVLSYTTAISLTGQEERENSKDSPKKGNELKPTESKSTNIYRVLCMCEALC